MKLNKQYTSYILFILGALLLAIGFSSCAKSEGDKLYGRWQFRYCEYPDGGTFANDSIFYCFDRKNAPKETEVPVCMGCIPQRTILYR